MSFLAIYLSVSLVTILLINSTYTIFNKHFNNVNVQVSNISADSYAAPEKYKSITLESGYGCALMLALSLILVSPSLLYSSQHAYLGNFSICVIYILLTLTMLIVYTVKPSGLNESALLIAFSTLGLILMIETSNLIGLYLGVELYSLSAYILASGAEGVYSNVATNSLFTISPAIRGSKGGTTKSNLKGLEKANKPSISAGLKYFLLSALSSGVLIAGISIVYACTGDLTLNGLSRISSMWSVAQYHSNFSGLGTDLTSSLTLFSMLGMGLIISTLIFKIGAAPFHFWVPDVYSKVSLFVNFYLISVPKIGILYTLIKISLILPCTNYGNGIASISYLILFFSILSLIVGAIGGLVQIKTTRLLAYSSISHAGYILLALFAAHIPVTQSTFASDMTTAAGGALSPLHIYSIGIYLAVYSLMTVNMFTILYCLYMNSPNSGIKIKYLSGFKGLSTLNPFLAASLATTLLSMAGVPPLAGFVAKFSVYMAVLDSGALIPAIFAVLCSVVTAVYYLRLIKISFFYEVQKHKKDNNLAPLRLGEGQASSTPSHGSKNGQALQPTLTLNNFSAITISLSTLIIIFLPILNPSILFLYLNY